MKYIIFLTLLKSNPGFVLKGYCISYCKDLPIQREKTSEIMVLTRLQSRQIMHQLKISFERL